MLQNRFLNPHNTFSLKSAMKRSGVPFKFKIRQQMGNDILLYHSLKEEQDHSVMLY